jgi:hypothetical protein
MASREYEATDPKDKVYSVLSLARVPMTTSLAPSSSESVRVEDSLVPDRLHKTALGSI